jgi:hypothetical protein
MSVRLTPWSANDAIGGALAISGVAPAATPPVYNHSIRAVALGDNGCLAATNQHPDVVPNYCTSYEGQRCNVTLLAGDKYAIRHPHSGLSEPERWSSGRGA